MNDYYVASIPLFGQITNLVVWLLLANVLLIGAVILFAFRAARLSDRVAELEKALKEQESQDTIYTISVPGIEDDRPIPIVRHRFGDAASIFRRRKADNYPPDFNPVESPRP